MKLQRYTAEPQKPFTAGPRASAPPDTGSSGIGQIGKAVSRAADLTFQANYNRMQLDDEIQLGIASQKYQEAFRFEIDTVQKTDFSLDEPLSQEDPDYFKKLTAMTTAEKDKLTANAVKQATNKTGSLKYAFKTKAAQARFETWKTANEAAFQVAIKSAVDEKFHDYQTAKFNKLISDALENGDLETADNYVDIMAKNELITEVEAGNRRLTNKNVVQKAVEEQVQSVIENEMTAIASQDGKDWNDAIEWVSDPKTIALIKDKTGAGFDSIKPAMEGAKAFALAQDKSIQTNDLVRYGLKNKSLDIWRGTTTKKQFDEELNAARIGVMEGDKRVYKYGDVTSDRPLLNQTDYEQLGNSAITELRKSQAEDIKRYTRDTANVILGPIASNLFTTDEQGNFILNPNALSGGDKEMEKYMLNFVNQYEDEIREWISKNPDKSGKEFYTFAQEKKYEYWNTSSDQIKAQGDRLKQSALLKDIPKQNGVFAPNTEEQFDRLPSGTEFISPDGKKRRKP